MLRHIVFVLARLLQPVIPSLADAQHGVLVQRARRPPGVVVSMAC
jgi:hypothetical protein